MNRQPQIFTSELYQLLRLGEIEEFNARIASGETINLQGANLRGSDLRGLDADNLDFTDAYFRQADLRGLDLRNCKLEGASIHNAHISGTYFPENISSAEIMMSLQYGTRMRCNK
ncbi:MAG: hypothetical protein CSB55_04525 [Candidatus Cloacimonadota bacterium]|nr:MAG: hypothetical protein CSB55_04525 [Candidatus Cloacimonadota bacterium]